MLSLPRGTGLPGLDVWLRATQSNTRPKSPLVPCVGLLPVVLVGVVPNAAQLAERVARAHLRRPRALRLKYLELPMHTTRRNRNRKSWAERMALWNNVLPEWAAARVDQFIRESANPSHRMVP